MMNDVVGNLKLKKFELFWNIENFREKMSFDLGECLDSPYFVTPTDDTKWKLSIYPGGQLKETKDYIALYLHYYGHTEVTAVCSFSAMNESSKTVYVCRQSRPRVFKNAFCCGYRIFLEKKEIVHEGKNTLVDDILTICCSISLSDYSDNSNDDKTSTFNYFEKLLDNGKFNDVTFVLGTNKIFLHKAILTSISPVFQAMFEHEMKENKESTVELTDIEYNVALEMFRYVYCRKVTNIDAIANDLFTAADRYDIVGLKILCEKSIVENLSVDNALKCFILAMTHKNTQLKTKSMNFILKNIKEFIDQPEFKQLNAEYKDEIIRALASKISS